MEKTIRCAQCGHDFSFSEKEQEFFKTKGFQDPKRCVDCRKEKRENSKNSFDIRDFALLLADMINKFKFFDEENTEEKGDFWIKHIQGEKLFSITLMVNNNDLARILLHDHGQHAGELRAYVELVAKLNNVNIDFIVKKSKKLLDSEQTSKREERAQK